MQSGERYAKEKNMKVLTEISPDDDAESAGDEDESAVKHTVLHAAAECTSEDIAKYLVKHGADVNKKDGDGNTAYDIAKENQFFSDVDFFEVGVFFVNTKENGYEKEEKEFMDRVGLSVGDYLSGWLLPVLDADKSDQLLFGESKRKL